MGVEDDVGAAKRVPRISEKKKERAYHFGREGEMGRGLFSLSRPELALGPFSSFLFSFPLFFSEFV
jgi:hypothetical protein